MRSLRSGAVVLLFWALPSVSAQTQGAERRPLNAPDESLTPSPVRCRPIGGGARLNRESVSTLIRIMLDSTSVIDRARAMSSAFPDIATFEELESRACAVIGYDISLERYAAFVDSVLPVVLALRGKSALAGDPPTPIAPPSGIRFDVYPRKTTVSWHAVPNADHYLLEVEMLMQEHARTPTGKTIDRGWRWAPHNDGLNSAVVRDTVATFYFIGAQPGRWCVRAIFADGRSSPASPWHTFLYLQ